MSAATTPRAKELRRLALWRATARVLVEALPFICNTTTRLLS